MAADVVKAEPPGEGDVTRSQLRDIRDVDSLYFTTTGGATSTTGFEEDPPVVTGAQIGDSGSAVHLFGAVCVAPYERTHTERGQRVTVALRTGILNLWESSCATSSGRAPAARETI